MAYSRPKFVVERTIEGIPQGTLYYFTHVMIYVYVADDTQEIESDSYYTFHQLVPATASASTVVDAGSIERTVCEGFDLLFTTQGLDHLVRVDRRDATHAVYWPHVFLNHMIGPYLNNGACCRYIIYYINTWCSCHRCQTLARDKCRRA